MKMVDKKINYKENKTWYIHICVNVLKWER